MRTSGAGRIRGAAVGVLLLAGCGALTACGQSPSHPQGHGQGQGDQAARADRTRYPPGIGRWLRDRVPGRARQVVAVYGESVTSARSTVVLYERQGSGWRRLRSWPAHNGRRGWTTAHREGDRRSPVGVFTLSDAGGVLPDPGARLPYSASSAFTPPSYWPTPKHHDFDYVIAIDYNRVRGTSPLDPRRPLGQSRGGGIWIHLDHGSGTSACVSVSRSAMTYLLRTLDPALHPVVVMGDRRSLAAQPTP
ncbi:L,D-transpeptidase family protein [Wenjunlia tyrosinilytica]|uniref:Lipoprotein n=1 Tax=Wenjunlia tyrosinilytica TaxID=1544741 RepID=A0A917ZSB8_9ACTN|nr:L,D-transpeptidase family protein [Wenjunlia tyrosinilytica]GGO91016.1 lipoprotein [Wenjunlia tyrosinilytica]